MTKARLLLPAVDVADFLPPSLAGWEEESKVTTLVTLAGIIWPNLQERGVGSQKCRTVRPRPYFT